MRRFVGHATGLACSLATIRQAPMLMDRAVCALGSVGLLGVQGDPCARGSAGLGEGGLGVTWQVVLPLLGLVVIMEAALWLQRLYSVAVWVPPVVAFIGCPILLSIVAGLSLGVPWFLWPIGVVMGTPAALAFTAYWFPLRMWQTKWAPSR